MVGSVYKWLKFPLLLAGFLAATGFSVESPRDAVFHPLYVSVIEMEHNPTDKTMEISCKVFTDDFEKAMAKIVNTAVDIHNAKDKAALEKQMLDYIRKHFQLKIDGKLVNYEWVGFENESQFTIAYIQVDNVNTAPKKVDVSVNLFHELYDKQINILHVISGGNRKSTKLDYPNTTTGFEF